MKAYCIFYGTKYSYNLVVDLQKEFNKCGVSLKCDYIKDFSVIKEHWHKLKYFDNTKNYGNIKTFNPILPKLDKLHISFKTFDDQEYDFNGKDHCMVLAVNFSSNTAF